MNTVNLFRQQAPGLAKRIEAADESELRGLAWATARAVVKRTGLSNPLIDHALQRGLPDAQLQAQVQALVEKLDDDYFALKEPLEERKDAGKTDPQVILAFSRARAANAVAAALGDDAQEAAALATYKALSATDDSQYLIDALLQPLAV
jgi:hypothetical protein